MKRSSSFGKTYCKTIIREIKQSFGRFAAIFGIVSLGVGFLSGLLATTPDMKVSVDRYFDNANMMDIFIKATMGLTRQDQDALAGLEVVRGIQGVYSTDALVQAEDRVLGTRIYGLPLGKLQDQDFINRIELIQGRIPEKEDECLVQEGGGFFEHLAIGTVLTIQAPDQGETYGVTEFTVTGIVKSPLYISIEREPSSIGNGRLSAVMYIDEGCYKLPVYTDFFITVKGASSLLAFTEPYQAHIDEAVAAIKTLGTERSVLRREGILAEARNRAANGIAQAEAEYAKARTSAARELAAARARLDAGAAELAAGEAELQEAETRVAQGRAALAQERQRVVRELVDNERELLLGEAELGAAKQMLADTKAQLDAAKPQVEKTRTSWLKMLFPGARKGVTQYDEGATAYQVGFALVSEKEQELHQGRRLLEAGKTQAAGEFAAAEEELAAAEAEIARGWEGLEAARRKLAAGEAEYAAAQAKAQRELNAGGAQLAEARRSITDITIDQPEWYVLDRNANVGCRYFKANSEKIADVATVFPVFFLLIAALVALTTMTRMVEEERIQIGTLKALGYQKRTILGKYLIYCGSTGVLGSATGMVCGFQGLPIIIYNAFATMYHLPPLVTQFNWPFGLIACGLVLTCTMGATVYACYHSLWEKPARLMLPRTPKSGKRIFLEYLPFIWKRMRFTHKVTARNLIRHKKHFFMTITGIAGCTSLMVAAFGLRDSMTNIARTHFEEILRYDLQVELAADTPQLTGILATLTGSASQGGDPVQSWTAIHSESGYVIQGDERFPVSVLVPQTPEDLPRFITLRDRSAGTALPFTDASVVLTEKMAEILKLRVGDTFILENTGGKRGSFTLSGTTEHYVGSAVYVGPLLYGEQFGGGLRFRTLLVRTGIHKAGEQDALIARILANDSVMGAEFLSQIQDSYNQLLGSIGFVVLVLIFAAGGLAMIVLYNLTNININERSREIATLRVLGFYQGEAAAYIFREITVLSIIGALAGLLLGIPLHRFIIGVAENTDLMFGRRIFPISFIISALITLFFSALVDLLMLKKLRNIPMADSMKAVD
ncbi:MAG: FtsX-like permease family protein [Treponema sp.]|jgi:putative ABC transport system permease protein|nr:FtsX-like permease family protein [Treponema sp.]